MQRIRTIFPVLAALLLSCLATAQNPARELMARGQADEALRVLDQQVKANGNNAEAYGLMSQTYFLLDDFDNAVRNGEKAVSLNGNSAEFQLWLGRAYGEKADKAGMFSAMGLARRSGSSLARALQLDPNNPKIRMDYAEFLVEAPGIVGGGKDKAARLASDIEKAQPGVAAWIRARIANKDRNLPEAERYFRQAADAGNDTGLIVELARFYKWTGRWADMDREITRALASKNHKPLDLFNAAELVDGSGQNLPRGIKLLTDYLAGKTVEEGPVFRAHFLIGEMFEKMGDKEKAAAEYQAALKLAGNYRLAKDGLRRLGR